MIPISLEVSAFGPYPDCVEIDFDQFKNAGMFLISGKTGSGKTMIFDAITFALYGKASGSLRKTDQLRCDSSDKTVATYVVLKFLFKNRIYEIKRNPKYSIEGRKTAKSPQAFLTCPDGLIIEGVSEVNQYIEKMIGINDQQFRQIAMIAQGEFSKVIHAGSDEREKILRTLFSTQHFVTQENVLRERVRELESNVSIYKAKKEQIEESLPEQFDLQMEVGEVKVLQQKQDDYKNEKDCLIKKIAVMKRDNLDIMTYQNLLLEKEKLTNDGLQYKELEWLLSLLQKCNIIYPHMSMLNQLTQEEQSLSQLLNENKTHVLNKEESFKQIEEQYLSIPQLKEQVVQLEQIERKYIEQINQYSEYLNFITQLEQTKQKLNDFNNEKERLDIALIEKRKQFDVIQQKHATLPSLEKELLLATHSIKQYIQIRDAFMELKELALNNLNLKTDLERKQQIYIDLEKIHTQKQQHAIDLNRTYMYSQAGILASMLVEDEPCPVCGSTTHPNIATTNELINQEDLEKANSDVVLANQQKDHAYHLLMDVRTQYDNRSVIYEEKLNKLNQYTLEQVLDEIIQLNNKIECIEVGINEIDEKQLIALQEECKTIEQTIALVQENIGQCTNTISNVEGKLVVFKGYESIDVETVKKQYDLNTISLGQLKTSIEQIELAFNDVKQALAILQNEKINIKEQLKSCHSKIKSKDDEVQSLLCQHEITMDQYHQSIVKIDSLHSEQIRLNEYKQKLVEVDSKINLLKPQVEQKEILDVKAFDDVLETLEKKMFLNESELKQRESIIEVFVKNHELLDKLAMQSGDMLHELEIINDVKDMFVGNNNQKLSFERYVLASYFEQILVYANVFLSKMTQGRYMLYRRSVATAKNSKQGLELDVFDVENGTTREVTTLSGGESFKASLSLALGMSQMIQSTSGGISIQTVFIDEGFGTLDSESLDQAIQCLMEVQSSDKLVGIISHVDELKMKISNQIIIDRKDKISRISIKLD